MFVVGPRTGPITPPDVQYIQPPKGSLTKALINKVYLVIVGLSLPRIRPT